jgi:hypothetical protein
MKRKKIKKILQESKQYIKLEERKNCLRFK